MLHVFKCWLGEYEILHKLNALLKHNNIYIPTMNKHIKLSHREICYISLHYIFTMWETYVPNAAFCTLHYRKQIFENINEIYQKGGLLYIPLLAVIPNLICDFTSLWSCIYSGNVHRSLPRSYSLNASTWHNSFLIFKNYNL